MIDLIVPLISIDLDDNFIEVCWNYAILIPFNLLNYILFFAAYFSGKFYIRK